MSEAPAITQRDVDAVLERLKALGARVREAREALAPLEHAMADAHAEFQRAVGPLRRREAALRLEIEQLRATPRETTVTIATPATAGGGGDAPRAAVAAEPDPDVVEKDVLLEHVVRVLDPMMDDEAADLVADLQRTCSDPAATLGDALEQLPWGPAWSRRPPHEALAEQHRRLTRWEGALQARLESLSRAEERMRDDPRHGLLRQRRRGDDAWRAFLAQSEQHHRWAIVDLEAELADLRSEGSG